jgi:nucleoside-diphosphate-sugar epimerase
VPIVAVMRLFLAGGTGAIGRPLVRRLAAAGHEVTIFTRDAERVSALGVPGVTAAVGDVLDADTLVRAVAEAQPEVVINQLTNLPQTSSPAALKRGLRATSRLRTEASATLVRAAEAAGARRVIAQSISFIYRPGPGVRSESDPLWTDAKGMIGLVAKPVAALESATLSGNGPDGVVLRYGAFYGPGTYYDHDGAFATMVKRRLLPVPSGQQGQFGFVHLDDAVGATMAALSGPAGVFNVVDDVAAPAGEWITLLAEVLGAKKPFKAPSAVMRAAGAYSAYLMCQQPAVSNQKAKTELGWAPQYPDWHEGLPAALAR